MISALAYHRIYARAASLHTLRPGQGFWVDNIWSPVETGTWYFFCHNSGIKCLVFPGFKEFNLYT